MGVRLVDVDIIDEAKGVDIDVKLRINYLLESFYYFFFSCHDS